MQVSYLTEHPLSKPAQDLIQFDIDSIRQFVSSKREDMPDVWLAVPEGYEKNGRVLRDSETSRLLAYSTKSSILYATDGCNSCARRLERKLNDLSADELKRLAADNGLRVDLLEALSSLARLNE